ncbi:hypothetical protein [Pseudonocardia sp.]|uniref:hypothetical protein n=1 Tax=Pseudonocardia sp. TaxID=60912 RepID=UPI00260D38B7|nr:hypothetical protein [Pseudonocardia sp.]
MPRDSGKKYGGNLKECAECGHLYRQCKCGNDYEKGRDAGRAQGRHEGYQKGKRDAEMGEGRRTLTRTGEKTWRIR